MSCGDVVVEVNDSTCCVDVEKDFEDYGNDKSLENTKELDIFSIIKILSSYRNIRIFEYISLL